MNNLIKRLRESREHAGLTQAALAKAVGISLRTINNYEKDSSKLTIVVAQKIAHACEVDEVWLLTGRGEMLENDTNSTFVPINDIIDKEHGEIVKKFRSKKEAKDLNVKLVALDWNSRSAFNKAVHYVEALWDGVEAVREDLQVVENDSSLNQKGRAVGKKERKKA